MGDGEVCSKIKKKRLFSRRFLLKRSVGRALAKIPHQGDIRARGSLAPQYSSGSAFGSDFQSKLLFLVRFASLDSARRCGLYAKVIDDFQIKAALGAICKQGTYHGRNGLNSFLYDRLSLLTTAIQQMQNVLALLRKREALDAHKSST
jgi:hypothetical protein